MRVSQYYHLNRMQGDLDFVDVDIRGDVRVFLDPRALRALRSEWGHHCRSLVQNFFHRVLAEIRRGNHQLARQLLEVLREPNETHLGLSRDKARGRALGPESANNVWEALSKSEAVKTGLLQDLEETILMVEGIGPDIVSDITTNVIREPLLGYTQQACLFYGIEMENGVDSGPLWNPAKSEWHSKLLRLPVTSEGRLVLVPKSIVRKRMDYDTEEYYSRYLLAHLAQVEASANSELVHLLKDGTPKVYLKDLREKYGEGKAAIVTLTRQYPQILEQYREAKRTGVTPPLDHDQLAESLGTDPPDWDELLAPVVNIPAGRKDADAYHDAVERLLTALLYPWLSGPEKEYHIHEGRKRIDIKYVNSATEGFFWWVAANYPAPYVYVECKNYSGDPANPELDQLSGRFSPSRGKFGLLVCRGFDDKELFVRRCRDTAKDDRGFIIALDDSDLELLVACAKRDRPMEIFDHLHVRFAELVM